MTEEKKTNPDDMVRIDDEGDEILKDDSGFLTLPMIPLRGLSIFPNMVLHFDIGREKSINALEKAMILNQKVFLVTQKDENTDLPTIEELSLLVDRTRYSPAINADYFRNIQNDWYWSKTESAGSSACAWLVHFGYGYVDGYHRLSYGFALAVRRASQ